jgi:D-alanine--poly(phosphoribitol) ligase subunit 2
MINVPDILFEICEDERVYDPECELIESGILDSYALIELFSKLEDYGIVIQITRIDRTLLKTPKTIEILIDSYIDNNPKISE